MLNVECSMLNVGCLRFSIQHSTLRHSTFRLSNDPPDPNDQHRYISNASQDVSEMLEVIGVDSIDRLFETIPADVKLTELLEHPRPVVGDRVAALVSRAGGEEQDRRRSRLVPRRRRVSALPAGVHRSASAARRVPDVVHAVSTRGLAGNAAVDLRISDAPVFADGTRRRERLALRRLDRTLRGGAAGRARGAQSDEGRDREVGASAVHRDRSHVRPEPRLRDRGSRLDERRPHRYGSACARRARAMSSPSPCSRRTSSA